MHGSFYDLNCPRETEKMSAAGCINCKHKLQVKISITVLLQILDVEHFALEDQSLFQAVSLFFCLHQS